MDNEARKDKKMPKFTRCGSCGARMHPLHGCDPVVLKEKIAELEAELARVNSWANPHDPKSGSNMIINEQKARAEKAEATNKVLEVELARWNELHKTISAIYHPDVDPDKWPSHGDKQLAHAALLRSRTDDWKIAEARNKELEAEVVNQTALLNLAEGHRNEDCKRLDVLSLELKSQAAECAAMRVALEEHMQAMVVHNCNPSYTPETPEVNWYDLRVRGKRALSHPPTKSERLALADRDVIEAAEKAAKADFEYPFMPVRKALDRRAAILAEDPKP